MTRYQGRLRFAAVVLAAGSSTRMRGSHKLLERVDGQPMVTAAVNAALDSGADPVVVVTGHGSKAVEQAIPDGARFVHNRAHVDGLSSSLRAGVRALPRDVDAAMVSLGDMPFVASHHFEALVRAWRPGAIVVPVHQGRRGHPVLWSAAFFDEMCALEGDLGAKSILALHPDQVVEVPTDDDAVCVDVDDPDDLERERRRR